MVQRQLKAVHQLDVSAVLLPMRAPNTELGLPSWASVLHTPSQNTDKCENFCIYLDQCSEMFLMTSGWRDTDTVAATQLFATTFSEVSSLSSNISSSVSIKPLFLLLTPGLVLHLLAQPE